MWRHTDSPTSSSWTKRTWQRSWFTTQSPRNSCARRPSKTRTGPTRSRAFWVHNRGRDSEPGRGIRYVLKIANIFHKRATFHHFVKLKLLSYHWGIFPEHHRFHKLQLCCKITIFIYLSSRGLYEQSRKTRRWDRENRGDRQQKVTRQEWSSWPLKSQQFNIKLGFYVWKLKLLCFCFYVFET